MPFLYVKVFCAKRLLAADFGTTPSSDPYVSLTVGSSKVKTKTIKKNLSPVWNQSFVVPLESFQDPIIFQVFDKDTFGSDDSLGAVKCFLHGINEGQEQVRLLKLYGGEHGSNLQAAFGKQSKSAKQTATTSVASQAAINATGNESAGKVVGKFFKKVQDLGANSAPKSDLEEKANIELGNQLTRPGLLGRVDDNPGVLLVGYCWFNSQEVAQNYSIKTPPSIDQLTVRLIGARNLLAADFGARPTSDPYCTLSVGKQKHSSKAIKSTLNPDWNQLYGFSNIQKGENLILSVWDKDLAGSDDSLGDGIVDLSTLPVGQEVFFLVHLVGGDSGENVHSLVDSKIQPVGQNVASVAAENAIGGQAGKVAGHLIKIIPQDKEDKNKGTVAIGITLSTPLGNGNPAQISRCLPADGPVTVEERSIDFGSPL